MAIWREDMEIESYGSPIAVHRLFELNDLIRREARDIVGMERYQRTEKRTQAEKFMGDRHSLDVI